jgi:hypothetical protein
LTIAVAVLAAAGPELAKTPPSTPLQPPLVTHPAQPGLYVGSTSQGRYLHLVVGEDSGSVVELRFAIAYRCAGDRRLKLRALVLRTAHPWQTGDTGGRGFCDWFSGPIGHDFHVTGTFSTSRQTLAGTLHSLLLSSRSGRCDTGSVPFAASFTRSHVSLPAGGSITLAQYQRLPEGLTVAGVERRVGPPADRESFAPAGVIQVDLPNGIPGGYASCLGYAWRDHPHRSFSLFPRRSAHRQVPGLSSDRCRATSD